MELIQIKIEELKKHRLADGCTLLVMESTKIISSTLQVLIEHMYEKYDKEKASQLSEEFKSLLLVAIHNQLEDTSKTTRRECESRERTNTNATDNTNSTGDVGIFKQHSN